MLSRLGPAILGAAALLMLPGSAQAGGTWAYGADQSEVVIDWSTDSGNPAFYTVYKLPVPIASATTDDSQTCVTPFEGDNTEVECQVSSARRFVWRRPHSGRTRVKTTMPMPCPGTIEHRVSEDNYSYISQNAITGPSTCPGGGGVTGGGGTDPGQQVLIDLFRASLIQSSNTTVHLDFSEQRGRGKVRLDVDRKVHLDPTAVKPCKHKDVVRWRKSMMRSICPDSGIGTGRLGSDPVTLLNTGMQGGAAMFAVHLDAAPSFFPITLGPSDQGAPFGQQLTIDFTSMPAGFDSVDLRLRSTGKKRRFIRVSCPTTRVWQFRARVEDGGAVSPPKDVTQKCKG